MHRSHHHSDAIVNTELVFHSLLPSCFTRMLSHSHPSSSSSAKRISFKIHRKYSNYEFDRLFVDLGMDTFYTHTQRLCLCYVSIYTWCHRIVCCRCSAFSSVQLLARQSSDWLHGVCRVRFRHRRRCFFRFRIIRFYVTIKNIIF